MGKISQKKHILTYHIKMSLDDLTDFEVVITKKDLSQVRQIGTQYSCFSQSHQKM